jgi:hypothetical protein
MLKISGVALILIGIVGAIVGALLTAGLGLVVLGQSIFWVSWMIGIAGIAKHNKSKRSGGANRDEVQ